MTATRLTLLLACLLALPAGADWLVTRDGSRLETRGPWTEKGRLIVFTSADGRLASLRADAVDLEASRRATAEAARAAERPAAEPAPTETPRRESRRITNADIPAGRTAPAAGTAEGEDAATAPPATEAAAADLKVRDTAQQIDPFDNHLVVTGTLTNASARTAAAVELVVQAYGPGGELLGTRSAELTLAALRPGASTGFEADFDDIYDSAMALRFAPTATFLETGSQEESRTSAEEAEDGFEDFGELEDFEDEP